MYQVFEKALLRNFLLAIGAISAIPAWYFAQPSTSVEWLRFCSYTISFGTVIYTVLTLTPIWRSIWKFFPILNKWIFPDLNGEWTVELQSNIGEIAKYHPDLKNKEPTATVQGTVKITQTLYCIAMVFHGADRYSNSETIFVKPVRTKDTGRFQLAYLYSNATPKPLNTDEQSHYGAGVVEILPNGDKLTLRGQYWTNRNWTKGLNTAGVVEMTKMNDKTL